MRLPLIHRTKHTYSRPTASIILTVVLLAIGLPTANAAPAVFAYSIAGSTSDLGDGKSPTGVSVDPNTGDLFVIFAGSATITVYDRYGRHPFEFSTQDRLAAPRQLVVDAAGRILVLGEHVDGPLAMFDYDGDFLGHWNPLHPQTQQPLDVAGIALDRADHLYVLSLEPAHVYVYSPERELTGEFDVFTQLDKSTRETDLIGRINIINERLVIPLPAAHIILCYQLSGEFDKIFGVGGGGPGDLGHPIDVAPNGSGGYLVLDKHRHTVLSFTAEGTFVSEFGGMGSSEGWFYHPTSMVLDAQANAVITQGLRGRIQVIDLAASLATDPTPDPLNLAESR